MQTVTQLLTMAISARSKAYAPYSKFPVGAALKTQDNKFYSGCNVENAAYGLTQCAEASAISNMVLDEVQSIAEILIVSRAKSMLTPCGACRQRIREFGNHKTLIHMCDNEKLIKTMSLGELLPESFGPHVF